MVLRLAQPNGRLVLLPKTNETESSRGVVEPRGKNSFQSRSIQNTRIIQKNIARNLCVLGQPTKQSIGFGGLELSSHVRYSARQMTAVFAERRNVLFLLFFFG